ncbi:MAG TPA: hypothetical protein VHH73_19615, partial [Verrucomicrobiae bacterium]|nr:hypothetical protein [Verrucomicrobiae bacterium]
MTRIAWSFFRVAFVAMLLGQIVPGAEAAAPSTNAPPRHYLFVVDSSYSMSSLAATVRDLMQEWVDSGLEGRFQTGDIIEAWAFTDEVRSRAMLAQAWLPELNHAAALRARKFVEGLRQEKPNRMDHVMQDVLRQVAWGEPMTILIISDADEPIKGTPFDGPINALYRQSHREMRRSKRPFVTTLLAENGQLAGWAICPGTRTDG